MGSANQDKRNGICAQPERIRLRESSLVTCKDGPYCLLPMFHARDEFQVYSNGIFFTIISAMATENALFHLTRRFAVFADNLVALRLSSG